jgi:hypothetical protein
LRVIESIGVVEVGAGLQGEQLGVAAAAGHQLLVGALLGDPAVVQHDDLIGVPDIGQPVSDQHCCLR